MARGSNVTLRIRSRNLPLFPGVLDLAKRGFRTRALDSNREYGSPIRVDPSVEAAIVDVVHDAQTSGGLLLAVEPDSGTASRLAARPDLASELGVVESRSEANLIIE
jgi:selenide,water dikinase